MVLRPTMIFAVLILSLSACGALSPMAEKPKVTVRSVSLSSAGFSGMDGQVAMDIFNPNGFGLPLHRVDWTISVGSAQAVSGSFEMQETIPAKGSAPVVGRLHMNVSSTVRVAAEVASGVRSYELQANLHFQTRLGELTVAVHHQGDLL